MLMTGSDLWPIGSSLAGFLDSKDALRQLKDHYKLVILSNVDNRSFAASHEKLGVEFDAIYTAEDVGSYKPSDRNFDYMLEKTIRFGRGKSCKSCIRLKACSTTMALPTVMVWHHVGFIVVTKIKALARP